MISSSYLGAAILKGVIKQVPLDFIVEEVSSSGRVSRVVKSNFDTDLGKLTFVGKKSNYLHFDAQKIGISTFDLSKRIAELFGVPQKNVSYCGLKDDYAITCQRICVKYPTKLDLFCNQNNFVIKNARWSEQDLKIGVLRGNNFLITIRNLTENKKIISRTVNNFIKFSKKGFPNFYGPQRFGDGRAVAHLVGKYAMDGKFKEAILTYLATLSTTESKELSIMRKDFLGLLKSKKQFREFPKEAFIENLMINSLQKNNLDFEKAFLDLPDDIKIFFICSYQSYLFNKMVSKRIDFLGKKASKKQKGDVLLNSLPSALMAGTNSVFACGLQGAIERQVLNEENVSFGDFCLVHSNGLKFGGKRRTIFSIPKNLKLISISSDELNKGKIKVQLSFFLDKGCYATTFLGRLISGLM